ncbi:MAG: TonB-dependent receptor [Pseudomonadota bacterium]
MQSGTTHKYLVRAIRLAITLPTVLFIGQAFAQSAAEVTETNDSTVRYEADYFAQYSPVSVNDMLNRIPGIGLALNSSGGGNSRGLGAGDQILIDGKRVAGKENESSSQLSRISANQVSYIEIIRGTSNDLDVRSAGPVVNIVLLEAESRSSLTAEVNADLYHDDTLKPGGSLSYGAQSGALDYRFSVESEPAYENRYRKDFAINGDFSPNDYVDQVDIREETTTEVSASMGYQLGEFDTVRLNASLRESDPPSEVERSITDFNSTPFLVSLEREDIAAERHSWEMGGDYEHEFQNGGRYKFLFIVNDGINDSTRERYVVTGANATKNLYIDSARRDRERIARTSYSWSLSDTQGLELGIERAQTILDSNLRYAVLSSTGVRSAAHGGLTPVALPNSDSTVEELRYEGFAMHNWQINERMTLESSLILEQSEIAQSGVGVDKSRDFDFLRPRVDYRFDVTSSFQLRASVEKYVSQLSFSDFVARTDNMDDEQDADAGNPDLLQEQSWRYEFNLEYRLPEDGGVLNTRFFYHDIQDAIDRVDISSSPTNLVSAPGNIGDAWRYGIDIDASVRFGFVGLPDAMLTAGLQVQDTEVTDPFLQEERRLAMGGRGFYSIGFRHDIGSQSLSYGFTYNSPISGNNKRYDIDDIVSFAPNNNATVFVEKHAFGGTTFRLESMNFLDSERCNVRTRFDGRTSGGVLEEIENSCSGNGRKISLKIRRTF